MRGEVIGLSTLRLIKKNGTGIGFALSATDLMNVLHRFYPDAKFGAPPGTISASAAATENPAQAQVASESQAAVSTTAQTPPTEGTGTIVITSDPDGAEIFMDEKFSGDARATLRPSVGPHVIVSKIPGRADWRRTLEVVKGNKASLKAVLGPAS